MPRSPLFRSAFLGLAASMAASFASLVVACADSASSPGGESDAAAAGDAEVGTDGARPDAATDGGSPATTCEITAAYEAACNGLKPDGGDPPICGASFDAWCTLSDAKINSAAYRRAEAQCLTEENCDGLARRDCEYRSYATATPTAAQTQLVAAYCATCEPDDAAACATRKTSYNPSAGPKSTDDVFVAAWELSDALVEAIRAGCTGSALDGADGGGADAGTSACLKSFASCAGSLYVDSLPDCPP